MQYWAGMICRYIVGLPKSVKSVSVGAVSEGTLILAEDVVATLREMGVLERRASVGGTGKGKKSLGAAGAANPLGYAVVSKARVREWMVRHKVSPRSPIVKEAFDLPDLSDESEMEESD